jgi:hypothetical protein
MSAPSLLSLGLRIAPWLGLVLAALALWGLNGRLDAASLKLHSTEAVLAQKEADARLSAELVQRQAERLAGLERQATLSLQQVQNAPLTFDCARSPAMRAAGRGLRELFARPGEPPAGPQPAAPLR